MDEPAKEYIDEASNAIACYPINGYDKGVTYYTGARIFEYEGDTLPDRVKVDFMVYRVKPFIEKPVRCFR